MTHTAMPDQTGDALMAAAVDALDAKAVTKVKLNTGSTLYVDLDPVLVLSRIGNAQRHGRAANLGARRVAPEDIVAVDGEPFDHEASTDTRPTGTHYRRARW